jgi:hypothetical protein
MRLITLTLNLNGVCISDYEVFYLQVKCKKSPNDANSNAVLEMVATG